MMRTGLIGRKLGMTRVFEDDGRQLPVSVIQVDDCQVVAQRTVEKDGYAALQLGAGTAKPKNVTKAMRGHFAKAGVEAKRRLAVLAISPAAWSRIRCSNAFRRIRMSCVSMSALTF